jgi:hypothetical protein
MEGAGSGSGAVPTRREAPLVASNPFAAATPAATTSPASGLRAIPSGSSQVADWGGHTATELSSASLVQAVARSSHTAGLSPASGSVGQAYPPGISPLGWRAWGIRVMRLTPITLLFDAVVLLNTVAILVELSLATDGPAQQYGRVVSAMVIVQYAMLLAFLVSTASTATMCCCHMLHRPCPLLLGRSSCQARALGACGLLARVAATSPRSPPHGHCRHRHST